jgi:hypothetical protein
MRIIECQQRTPEWIACRVGKLTGSAVAEAFATRQDGKEAAGRRNTRLRLALERLTGKPQENGYESKAMMRGAEMEQIAIAAYEAETGIFVEPVGFIEHDTLLAGCSPDGLTAEGGTEIKCPEISAHYDYLRGGLPKGYYLQCVHGLWLTGRAWWDFVSFHPDFPEPLRLKRSRIYAKDVDLTAHELNVRTFLSEVEKELDGVRALLPVGVNA